MSVKCYAAFLMFVRTVPMEEMLEPRPADFSDLTGQSSDFFNTGLQRGVEAGGFNVQYIYNITQGDAVLPV